MPFFQPSSHKRKKAYVIGEHIGSGGYGEVKAATRLEDGAALAVKIVPKVHVTDLEAQVQRQETLLTLDHKHVVKLHEWFESKDKYYLVFELAAGGELYDHLMEEGRFGEEEAREVAHALVDALQYLHAQNIVHRDIKPENVLYRTPPGHNGFGHDDCVISDFGLAAQLSHPTEVLHTHCGSPGYTAPEVYSAEGYSIPADMWSLGIVVFATLGGRFPYKKTEPRALALEARTTKLYFPSSWSTISPLAKDFIRKLLTVDPKLRMTAPQALLHPWFHEPISVPPSYQEAMTTVTPPEPQAPILERRATMATSNVTSAASSSGLGASAASGTGELAFPPLEKQATHGSAKGIL